MTSGQIKALIIGFIGVLAIALSWEFVEVNNAKNILMVQSVGGGLTSYKTAGPKPQIFGSTTLYDKLDTYEFETKVQFNDGGHGIIHGSINYELPLSDSGMIILHSKYGSMESIQKDLVEVVTNKCVYLTGMLMSSTESYTDKRASLIHYIADQIENGVYKTNRKDIKIKDPVTGAEKTVVSVELALDANGQVLRQEEAVLKSYGIHTSNFALVGLEYDKAVQDQIKQQQELVMKVQTAVASAKEAEQRAITAAKEGEAAATEAKWAQEKIKAQQVTEAQQKLEVATLAAKAAEQTKRADILLGEGQATRKRLVMQADGALDPKLEAYKAVNFKYAEEFGKYQGNWVPGMVMGGGSGSSINGATSLIELLSAKTARDLSLDMSMSGKKETSR